MIRRTLSVAALGAVLAVSLAACGGGAVKEQPGDVPTLRRGISAVRCLLFLGAKMRRRRALRKFRRSANIAHLVGLRHDRDGAR